MYILTCRSISGLVVEYIVAIDVTRVRFPADACIMTSEAGRSDKCQWTREHPGHANRHQDGAAPHLLLHLVVMCLWLSPATLAVKRRRGI
jgi:hypothetical protein